jgi:hypothetical protein
VKELMSWRAEELGKDGADELESWSKMKPDHVFASLSSSPVPQLVHQIAGSS